MERPCKGWNRATLLGKVPEGVASVRPDPDRPSL